jgi:hypothetical protein
MFDIREGNLAELYTVAADDQAVLYRPGKCFGHIPNGKVSDSEFDSSYADIRIINQSLPRLPCLPNRGQWQFQMRGPADRLTG